MTTEKTYKQFLADRFKELRPKLRPMSISAYANNLANVSKTIGVELHTVKDIIDNGPAIFEYVSKKTSNAKSFFATLVVFLCDKPADDQSTEQKDIIAKFRKNMYIKITADKEDDDKQELTDSQMENFIPWTDVLKFYKQLKEQCTPLMKLDELTKKQFELVQHYILLSMYVLTPPRRSADFVNFKLRGFSTGPESEDNYMIVPRSKKSKTELVFHTYKNQSRLGIQSIKIDNKFRDLLLRWFQLNKHEYLIVNNVGGKISNGKIASMMKEIFGKKISTSLLRHIYLTHEYGSIDINKLQETSEAMGNSPQEVQRILRYISKANAEKGE